MGSPRKGGRQHAGGSQHRKQCNCKNSRCLKLYCECFASGRHCEGCNCTNCFNNRENELTRQTAVEAILERNPNAFRPKIQGADEMLAASNIPRHVLPGADGAQKHSKGCNCKKSACLKKYCECFQAGVFCSASCKCMDCKNFDGSEQRAQVIACLNMQPMSGFSSQPTDFGQSLVLSREALTAASPSKRARSSTANPMMGLLQQQQQQQQPSMLQSPGLLPPGILPGGAVAAAAAAAAMAAAGMRPGPPFAPPALSFPGLPGLSLPAALQAQLQQQQQQPVAQAYMPRVAPAAQATSLPSQPQPSPPPAAGILPHLPFHKHVNNAMRHNDEAKPTPLVGALAAGLQSIEVDCYLLPDTQGQRQLVIGHDWDSLDPSRLLGPAYLQPLAQRIAAQGGRLYPGGALTGSGAAILLLDSKLSSQRKRGVNASEEEMYEAIEALLWSFHNAYTGPGQLFSRHSQGHTWPGALLAVLSGDRPAPQFVLGRHKQRGVAGRQGQEMEEGGTWLLTLDGRLTDLGIELETPFGAPNAGNQWNPAQPRKMMLGDKLPSHLTAVLHPRSQPGSGAAGVPVSVMPLVSQGLYGDPDSALPDCADPTQLLPAHKARLRYLAEAAHAQGRLLRVWDHPDAPDVWGTLLGLGLDLVNVEDCAAFQAWAYQQLGLQPVAQSQLGARTLQTQGRVSVLG